MEKQQNGQEPTILESRPLELFQIKDYAVMMELAGTYICEESILSKMAEGIETSLDSLKVFVSRVRRQFVGKPLHEVDTSGPLDGIQELAKSLARPDEQTKEKIKQGYLGGALMAATRQLAGAIDELIERAQGRTERYRKKDLLAQAYDRVKFFAQTLFSTYKLLTKVIICVAVVCLVSFFLLFVTMETEKEIAQQVAQVKAVMQEKQNVLDKISREIIRTRAQTEALVNRGEELGREEKIKLIQLKLKEHSLKQKKEKIQFELEARRKQLDQRLRMLEQIKQKSFLKRLLRIS